jgi:pyrroline-5-carboxylate reductase
MTENLITLVGCGNMGKALLQGWLKSGLKANYLVIEPNGLPEIFKTEKSVSHSKTLTERIKNSSIIVLAVKPQVLNEICNGIKPFTSPKTLILSIAAGRSIECIENIFSAAQPIVRSMPNLPASIGKSMTVVVGNAHVTPTQKKLSDELLGAVGMVEWLAGENLMDAATALVGNGPAYVFYLIEVLAEAGKKAGLGEDLAKKMARQVVIGGATLAALNLDTDAATLRKNVTSPGGTTEAALKILMNGEMQKLFDEAIKAGTVRSKELSS